MGFASGLGTGKPGVPAVCHKRSLKTQIAWPIISSLKNATARGFHEDCKYLLVQMFGWPSGAGVSVYCSRGWHLHKLRCEWRPLALCDVVALHFI